MTTKAELQKENDDLRVALITAKLERRNAIGDKDRAEIDLANKNVESNSDDDLVKSLHILISNRLKSKFAGTFQVGAEFAELPEEYHWLCDLQERINFRNSIMSKGYAEAPYG